MTDQESVFHNFTEEMRALVGPALRSVILYGSAASGEFRPGISDYNFFVVADRVDIDLLDRMAARAGRWRKKRIGAPLLVTPDFIERARDSYPLEFIAMKAGYRVLHGEDLIAGLTFRAEDVRLQCERELRSKLLLFRKAYMESEGAPRRLKELVQRGFSSLVAIFRGLLYLKDGPWKLHGPPLWDACAESIPLPRELLHELSAMREGRGAPSREAVRAQLERTLRGLEALSLEVDRW